MNRPQLRFGIALVLLVGWLGYLGWLALGHGSPMIVSRTQLMNAPWWVVVEIELDTEGKPKTTVQIDHVAVGPELPESSLVVANLTKAHLPPNKPITGPGKYLVLLTHDPLRREQGKAYAVASTRYGGYDDAPLIYPWTPEVERQVKELAPTKK